MSQPLVIAIDGPSGAGKSSVARTLASRMGVTYIDSGAMYRAVALWALRAEIDVNDAFRVERLAREAHIEFGPQGEVLLNGEDVSSAIRSADVTEASSKVAAFPGVRRAMREEQQRIGSVTSVVMEGRDIGTVVFPDARVKIYLDAQPAIRAGRRATETGAEPAEVARELAERDRRDSTRSEAPLTQAPDAEYVDSTGLSLDEVVEAILKIIRDRTSNGKLHS